MDTTQTDVPASYRIRRTVPPYKPARTPHVGRTVNNSAIRTYFPCRDYVVIREADNPIKLDAYRPYWCAPVLEDGSLGKMDVLNLSKAELTA